MRIALVTAASRPDETGGAETLYEGLHGALRALTPHQVDRLDVPIADGSFDALLASYLRCYDLDLSAYDLVISTKAPTYALRHPRHVSYLLHTVRVFYDAFELEYGGGSEEYHRQRGLIQHLDAQALSPPRTRRHCAVGRTAFDRLTEADPRFRALPVTILPHPPGLTGFREPRRGEYLLCPGRLHPWKRVDLLIKAFRRVRRDVPLKIVGRGRDEARLRRLAAGDPRIQFMGHVGDAELVDLYARAIAVPFVPFNEDYGLITIEAFLAGKPVITCTDSGEPLRFVRDLETGLVAAPDPDALARKLELVIDEPELAAGMGQRGHAAARAITWERVIDGLVGGETERSAVRAVTRAARRERAVRVLVTDNQPIQPATGGGRLRLLGLYGTLTEGLQADYVGTYDWLGPERRELRLTPVLTETTVPLARDTFALQAALSRLAPDRTVADVSLPWFLWSSPELVRAIARGVDDADVVVVSHPWMYPAVREAARRSGKPVIYDSHNCEALLRGELLGGDPLGDSLAGHTRFLEGLLCQESTWILACSEEDRQAFVRLYGVPEARVRIVPNGTFVERIVPGRPRPPGARLTAIFVGSAYGPNVEAAQAIVTRLAPALPEVSFVLAGGVSDAVTGRAPNVVRLGVLSDEGLARALGDADLALNPVTRGSGVNIKMLDYLAAGLPTVTTAVGARGLAVAAEAFEVAELDEMPAAIRRLHADPAGRAARGARARELAVGNFDWRMISRELGELLLETAAAGGAAPLFTVIVPTYERPEHLRALLARLDEQTCRDFEVIVVDQSARPRDMRDWRHRYAIRYLHTPERGAVRARNLGLRHAGGRIVAFTDDDCLPEPAWLEHAARHFADPKVAGLEGLVRSDQTDRERWRIVSNEEGGGRYMTANLLVRREVLDSVGGFDDRFDRPHYREDTDLGWRVLSAGRIPFARDVVVLHPAHPKNAARESDGERATFFVQDPLLYFKHPERYVALLRSEGHHLQTPGFWPSFEAGIARHAVPVSADELRAALAR